MSSTYSAADLAAEGFEGFLTVGQLHRSGCLEVPDACGVYVVLRRGEAPHRVVRRSQAPAWRGMDPTRPIEELTARVIDATDLLYVNAAPGSGVRHRLRQRLKRFLRFGHGSVVGHWSGRFIWQLGESSRLVLAWRPCAEHEDARALADDLLRRFEAVHHARPYANPLEDDSALDAD
ncbi:MAG: hypothetical protein RL760_155 [Candidatus Eisenbacteria bacterium]